MPRQKQPEQHPTTTENTANSPEPAAQEVQDLPNREAMSILTGLPIIPGLPPGLLGDNTGLPTTAAPDTGTPAPIAQPDPTATPGDTNTFAPTNDASITNFDSAGTTESTGATQEAPIVQRA